MATDYHFILIVHAQSPWFYISYLYQHNFFVDFLKTISGLPFSKSCITPQLNTTSMVLLKQQNVRLICHSYIMLGYAMGTVVIP